MRCRLRFHSGPQTGAGKWLQWIFLLLHYCLFPIVCTRAESAERPPNFVLIFTDDQAIAEIDWSVGQILDTIKANGLDENTLVLFTSDNGPPKNTLSASPGRLRGHKGTTFEGGMREPTVVRWPGKIPAGKTNDELLTTMDLPPTFAKDIAENSRPAAFVKDPKPLSLTLANIPSNANPASKDGVKPNFVVVFADDLG